MSTWIVTGAGGNVGSHLLQQLLRHRERRVAPLRVIALHRNAVPLLTVPTLDGAADDSGSRCGVRVDLVRVSDDSAQGTVATIRRALDSSGGAPARVECVIHLAAVTNIATAFRDGGLAVRTNVHLTRALAELCDELGAALLYASTDMVYDGEPPSAAGFTENDAAQPLSFYGASKLAGEQEAVQRCSRTLVARLPLMYGVPFRGDAAESPMGVVIRAVRNVVTSPTAPPPSLSAFWDELRTPLSYVDAAVVLIALATIATADRGLISLPEVYNVAGPYRVSRYDLLQVIVDGAARGAAVDVCVSKTSQRDFNESAPEPRPRDLSMTTRRLKALFEGFLAQAQTVATSSLVRVGEEAEGPGCWWCKEALAALSSTTQGLRDHVLRAIAEFDVVAADGFVRGTASRAAPA